MYITNVLFIRSYLFLNILQFKKAIKSYEIITYNNEQYQNLIIAYLLQIQYFFLIFRFKYILYFEID